MFNTEKDKLHVKSISDEIIPYVVWNMYPGKSSCHILDMDNTDETIGIDSYYPCIHPVPCEI